VSLSFFFDSPNNLHGLKTLPSMGLLTGIILGTSPPAKSFLNHSFLARGELLSPLL